MKFEQAVLEADKLAFSASVGRVTLNIVENPKTQTLHIVEELTRYDKEGREIKQRFQTHIDLSLGKVNVNDETDYLKTRATFRFLGKEMPVIEDLGDHLLLATGGKITGGATVTDIKDASKKEAPPKKVAETPKEVEKPVAQAEAPKAEEPPKKKKMGRPKKSEEEKAATKKKAASRKQPIKFDREVDGHLSTLAEIIKGHLGADWKTEENKQVAKKLILQLQKQVDLFAPDGDTPLDTFKNYVIEYLDVNLAKKEAEAEDDLSDLE